MSEPVSWMEEANADASPTDPIVARAQASSHAASPTDFGRLAPSSGGSKSESGTFTGFSPSTLSDTTSRGTSKSTTLAGPAGVCTWEFCLGARLLKSL